ncbi:hypothetical protein N7495_008796 [Penicillium taxi]|uniref:uncharacterized protein n=1 Tax=Penicillium taxi TaxID=168475 RepID=UPI002544E633|nr:uncharacterized protein N7495_008796 [Penicillium taxi]KAJ5888755.1 hypothetical protein N7495_008796 [Penicillium taxi]
MTENSSGLQVGQRFSSLEDFKTAIRSISVRQHWELRVIRSNKKSVVIGCRSTGNCFFRVVCRSNKNATYITSLQDNHLCQRSVNSPTRTPVRSEASHVRFLLSEIPKLFDMKARIKAQDVVHAVKRYHGYDISMRQAQRALIKLQSQDSLNDDEQAMLDMNTNDQDSPTQSQSESQGDAGPAYQDLSENRWMTDPLQSSLMVDDDTVNSSESPSVHTHAQAHVHAQAHAHAHAHAHVSTASAAQAGQPMQDSQIQQPPIRTAVQSNINTDPRPIGMSQQSGGYDTGASFPLDPEHPKPPNYQPRNDHSGASQIVLTNFKIEFTCTTCGAMNQSFFPNQGNVTGGGYMSHHSAPNPGSIVRHADLSSHGVPITSNGVTEDGGYSVNALNARVMQSAWAGGLGVPIGPNNP